VPSQLLVSGFCWLTDLCGGERVARLHAAGFEMRVRMQDGCSAAVARVPRVGDVAAYDPSREQPAATLSDFGH
jgi:hypothetical protein